MDSKAWVAWCTHAYWHQWVAFVFCDLFGWIWPKKRAWPAARIGECLGMFLAVHSLEIQGTASNVIRNALSISAVCVCIIPGLHWKLQGLWWWGTSKSVSCSKSCYFDTPGSSLQIFLVERLWKDWKVEKLISFCEALWFVVCCLLWRTPQFRNGATLFGWHWNHQMLTLRLGESDRCASRSYYMAYLAVSSYRKITKPSCVLSYCKYL